VQEGGFLGYMQSTGDYPSDGQPFCATKVPDRGLRRWLLLDRGSEL